MSYCPKIRGRLPLFYWQFEGSAAHGLKWVNGQIEGSGLIPVSRNQGVTPRQFLHSESQKLESVCLFPATPGARYFRVKKGLGPKSMIKFLFAESFFREEGDQVTSKKGLGDKVKVRVGRNVAGFFRPDPNKLQQETSHGRGCALGVPGFQWIPNKP